MGESDLDRFDVSQALRDYGELVERYEKLLNTGWEGGVLGSIDGLPVYHLALHGESPAPFRWLLGAGLHGDEPAGHLALLEFLEQDATGLRDQIDLVVLPCINPWGYVHDRRENSQGIDINRHFEEDELAEVRLCKQLLNGERFDLFLEFHEDWEFDGYYLFETRQENAHRVGPSLIEAVRAHGPIYRHADVEGFPVTEGVVDGTPTILAKHDIGAKPLPLWLFQTGRSQRSITSETPSKEWDMARRIASHVTVARKCVELLAQV